MGGEGGNYYVFLNSQSTKLEENEKPRDILFPHCKSDLLQLASK